MVCATGHNHDDDILFNVWLGSIIGSSVSCWHVPIHECVLLKLNCAHALTSCIDISIDVRLSYPYGLKIIMVPLHSTGVFCMLQP
jgi:hypothetical protein